MMKLVVWVLSLNFLHVFTLFVIDIHKNMLISLFPTPFDHFQFLGSAGQIPKLILTLCLTLLTFFAYKVDFWNGYSPVWVLSMCFCRWPVVIQENLHILHLWGFSPVCNIMCRRRSTAWLVEWLHCVQLCSFSPVWVSRCLFRCWDWLNDLLHCAQLWIFSPLWVFMWFRRWSARMVE